MLEILEFTSKLYITLEIMLITLGCMLIALEFMVKLVNRAFFLHSTKKKALRFLIIEVRCNNDIHVIVIKSNKVLFYTIKEV